MMPAPAGAFMERAPKNAALKREMPRARAKTPVRLKPQPKRGHGLRLLEDIGSLLARSHDLQ